MQNIDLICLGKLNAAYCAAGVAEYQKRLSAFCNFRIIELPEELIREKNAWDEEREGREVFDKTIELSCDYSIVSEFRFDGTDYIEEKFVAATNALSFGKLMPAEFKFFTVIK